ncbi:MAG: penicillin acylase family protein, partial [Acidobacteria bacterium]|nr:penicillin acylase family protein [Acidobacteriota bacterium]
MTPRIRRASALLFALCLAMTLCNVTPAADAAPLPGLREEARVVWDTHGVPHIYTTNDLDASFMMGYVHAHDRLFQMDTLRRLFSGQLAELLGPDALPSDVQLRTLGLRRAAEETWATSAQITRVWLEAYADGVNAYLESQPLPPQYGALELTRASIPKWTPVDSLVAGKGLAFGLSFDLDDIDRTVSLMAFQAAGNAAGFDGTALFFEDLFRSAPPDPTVSIPEGPATGPQSLEGTAAALSSLQPLRQVLRPETLELARTYRDRIAQIPTLSWALDGMDTDRGSNWWLVAGQNSASGLPMLANDPHLALDSPATFYEVHLLVFDPQRFRVLNANGVSFAGAPAIAQGCNGTLCWGSTVNPLDVTDVYQEVLVVDPATGLPTHTMYKGEAEPLVLIPQVYRVNQIGDGAADNFAVADVGPTEGGLTFVVPRRNNGP